MTTTQTQVARYQTILDGMTDMELVAEFSTITRQQATVEFGSDLWEAGLTMLPMIERAILSRMVNP